MDIGKEVQKLRVSKDIKQADIAMALEIDVSSYSRLERKGNKITVEQLVIIASALGVSLNELLGLDSPVVNQDKVKELEKRIEELESRIKDKDDRLLKWSIKEDELLMRLCTDIIIYFWASDSISDNLLYERKDEPPFCELRTDEETLNRIKFYLTLNSPILNPFGSELYRKVVDSFRIDEILYYMNDFFVIERNKQYISEHVVSKFKETGVFQITKR